LEKSARRAVASRRIRRRQRHRLRPLHAGQRGSVRMRAWPACGVSVTATVLKFTSSASGLAL
jgi:hypothetical protein